MDGDSHEAEEKDGDDIRLDDLELRQCGLAKHFAGLWWVGSEMTNGSSLYSRGAAADVFRLFARYRIYE